MANWQSFLRRSEKRDRSSSRKSPQTRTIQRPTFRSLRMEPFEERLLFAIGPTLSAVIPAQGSVVANTGTLHVAPTELDLKFSSSIDATTLINGVIPAIEITETSTSPSTDIAPIVANPAVPGGFQLFSGFFGIGSESDEVAIRFPQALTSGTYQINITSALKGTNGGAYSGTSTFNFTLDLGAQIVSVVPQPVTRTSGGQLSQATNEVDVYFDTTDPLNVASAQNPAFYELIRTAGTATPADDTIIHPTSISYSSTTTATLAAGEAKLFFGTLANSQLNTAGAYRLRIGDSEPLATFTTVNVATEPGSGFNLSTAPTPNSKPDNLGTLFTGTQGTQTATVAGPGAVIGVSPVQVLYPGSDADPGSRPPTTSAGGLEDPVNGNTTNTQSLAGVIPVFDYNFQSNYGTLNGSPAFNVITPTEEQQVEQVFSYWAHYLGVEFVQTPSSGFTVAVGDTRVLDLVGGNSLAGFADQTAPNPSGGAGQGEAIISSAINWNSLPLDNFFAEAMNNVGVLLGLGFDTAGPPGTVMTGVPTETAAAGAPGTAPAEPVFPGDLDIVHGQYLLPSVGNDINVYQFSLQASGQLSLETFAQRLSQLNPALDPSQLDTVITLYDANGNIIARNDNYYGTDSFVQQTLSAGTYFVAITSTGNTNFNPMIANSGFGGTTEGGYQLRLAFTPTPTPGITDATGTPIDGDGDGTPGGVDNFWFDTTAPVSSNVSNTIFVDKSNASAKSGAGTPGNPFVYNTISAALTAAANQGPGTIVRIEGNNTTALTQDLSYNIGFDSLNRPLSDGTTFQVPQGVTVMVDAGAIIKLRGANITVGSSSVGINNSGGALQLLGTPNLPVYVTSFYNTTLGKDLDTAKNPVGKGDWGGIVFNDDSDNEAQGIFVDYVNHANISYGGGQVSVNSLLAVYDPINLVSSRPTISFNTITTSADSAMSGDPNSFQESEFQGVTYQADYSRVGPNVHGNLLLNNSINGMFVRIRTENGESVDPLTDSARFASTDIAYVIDEALEIQGLPGGLFTDPATGKLTARINARLMIDPGVVVKLNGGRIETQIGAQFIAEGTLAQPIIFTSLFDQSYGAGGTFDTDNVGIGSTTVLAEGNWGGLFFGPLSIGSVDHAVIEYGGGSTTVEGGFDKFNAIEIHQAQVRIANSTIEFNASGGGGDRDGRTSSTPSVIFIVGAQPVILNNIIANNDVGTVLGNTSAISINVDALNSDRVNDWGDSTGPIDLQGDFLTNLGPLIHGNLITNNPINGMIVRGGTVTTDVVMDDTDIVHVILDPIATANQNSLTGTVRLESSPTASLVVKLLGQTTGLTASGVLLDTSGRVGGSVQIIGQPTHPVVLTSLYDSTVGAGLTPAGQPDKDTYNLKGATPAPLTADPTQGPVILYGANIDAHGSNVAGLDDGWVTLRALVQYVMQNSRVVNPANANTILVVGIVQPPPSPVWWAQKAIEAVASSLGYSIVYVSAENSNLAGVNFAAYPMVYIPSDAADVDGGISNASLSGSGGLTSRSSDLLNYINNQGGGLLALSENGAAAPYSWLAGSTSVNGQSVPSTQALVTQQTGGNSVVATDNLPSSLSESTFALGLPWLNDFNGPVGYDNLQPWLKDPANGQYVMMGLAAGGTGLQGQLTSIGAGGTVQSQNVATPGDWQGVTFDTLSNDTNLAVVNEVEQGFSSTGDTNGTPSTAQYIGTLAPNQNSGDENNRLGFEVHGAISQTVTSPGGGDVDVYSFTGTAGSNVWLQMSQTASSLDSVVELVDANGAVLAQDDNAVQDNNSPATSTLHVAAGVNAFLLPAGLSPNSGFASPNFFSVNPLDAGMQVTLPGTVGTTNTYYVRVRASNPNYGTSSDVLTGGLTKGAYVLQARVSDQYEYPGSVVQYADIRYAQNGISVIGQPSSSPLLGNASATGPTTNQGSTSQLTTSGSTLFPSAQDLGNLLGSPNDTISSFGQPHRHVECELVPIRVELLAQRGARSRGAANVCRHVSGRLCRRSEPARHHDFHIQFAGPVAAHRPRIGHSGFATRSRARGRCIESRSRAIWHE